MEKRERLEATIAGDVVDRVAVSAWRHQPVDDQSAKAFAEATLAFQREFDFDFVKVTPESSYCVKQWGLDDIWRGHPHGTRDILRRPIREAPDWNHLVSHDPHSGQMAEILMSLGLIGAELGDSTPFIQTIFSPLAQAVKMAGPEVLMVHLRREPDIMRSALQVITDQTLQFIEAARGTGISGIFFAMQCASYAYLSEAEYREFGQPYDLQILGATRDLWLNVLHLHGDGIMFSVVSEYPAAILNWHDRATPPSLSDGLREWRGAVCGGVRQEETLVHGTPDDIRAEALDAIDATRGRRFVLGTGCVAPIVTPYGNLRALRDAALVGVGRERGNIDQSSGNGK